MTVYIKTQRRTHKIDGGRFLCFILTLSLLITITAYTVDFLRFPDCYLSTWRYQLKNEIAAGNEQSIEYYQTHYIDKGRFLFSEDTEVQK